MLLSKRLNAFKLSHFYISMIFKLFLIFINYKLLYPGGPLNFIATIFNIHKLRTLVPWRLLKFYSYELFNDARILFAKVCI